MALIDNPSASRRRRARSTSRTGAGREAARSVNHTRGASLNTSGARCAVFAIGLTVTKSGVVMAMMIIYFCKYFNETDY